MEIQALTRNARMSPRKVREIANQIQGRPVPEAIDFLTLIPRKSARLLAKTLKSAVANAETTTACPPPRSPCFAPSWNPARSRSG
jgi:large subunit ribosomal protein L22